MIIAGQSLTRREVISRVGSVEQLGGTRHYSLTEGRGAGVRAIDIDTGAGLRFTVLPDRGMDISRASYKDKSLAYGSPTGETHPAYFDARGNEWLRGFYAGLLTTCGLTYLGPPTNDGATALGLHGRIAHTPARRVNDLSRWEEDEYIIEVQGIVEEGALFTDKVRLTRTIHTRMGETSFQIHDRVKNFGFKPAPCCIVYHMNLGFPLLDDGARFKVAAEECKPFDAVSAQDEEFKDCVSAPVDGIPEKNYQYRVKEDEHGWSAAMLFNEALGLGFYQRFDARTLPWLNQWKLLGPGEYVMGIEPGNVPVLNRCRLREKGLLVELEPGEAKEFNLEVGVLDGEEAIRAFCYMVDRLGQ